MEKNEWRSRRRDREGQRCSLCTTMPWNSHSQLYLLCTMTKSLAHRDDSWKTAISIREKQSSHQRECANMDNDSCLMLSTSSCEIHWLLVKGKYHPGISIGRSWCHSQALWCSCVVFVQRMGYWQKQEQTAHVKVNGWHRNVLLLSNTSQGTIRFFD